MSCSPRLTIGVAATAADRDAGIARGATRRVGGQSVTIPTPRDSYCTWPMYTPNAPS
jgi:hypothetical protein